MFKKKTQKTKQNKRTKRTGQEEPMNLEKIKGLDVKDKMLFFRLEEVNRNKISGVQDPKVIL